MKSIAEITISIDSLTRLLTVLDNNDEEILRDEVINKLRDLVNCL